MDRTMIAPWKAEEKELSEKLYKKLMGLNLLHPPTDEFRKCFTEDMFLKPNQQAFFQVMHYLFKLLDPIEFKKRFYWPITDKKAEANFRSSTIEYLKHLNEKHQLNWTNIKSYLVVMPGGMKFINFLLDFVSFVVQEQIKQREKLFQSSDVEYGEVSDLNMKRMLKQNAFFKEYASAYISESDRQIEKLKEKTESIRSELKQMAKASNIDINLLIDDTFLKEFEESNRQLYIEKFSKPTNDICSLEKPLFDLKQVIDKFQNKEAESKIDREAVRRSLVKIQKCFPDSSILADEDTHATNYDEAIPTESLISAFNCIIPIIEEQLSAADQIPLPSNFVTNELSALKTELQQIEEQITGFQKKINHELKKKSSEKKRAFQETPIRGVVGGVITHSNTENTLLMKCVATPPIKLEIQEGSRNSNPRLPFLDDLGSERSEAAGIKAGMESLNNLLAVPRSARKNKNADISIDLNNTVNKSKIIDPMQLLRTINKDTTKSRTINQDLSTLGTKWKDRQCLFGKDIDSTPATTKNESLIETSTMNITSEGLQKQKLSNTTLVSSPYTPFSSQNERTRIARSQLLDASGGGNILYTKKLSAVKKVQDASLNFHNLSTSPSGRLDPLVTLEAKDVPKLLLNDMTLGEENENSVVWDKKSLNSSAKFSFGQLENDENDLNSSNTNIKFGFNLNRHEDDDDQQLFNISDSVLKDVIM